MANIINAFYTIRSAVAADDASNPATAQGKFNPSLYGVESVAVDVVLGGTTPQWTVTPLYWSSTAATYVEGVPFVVDHNWRFITRVDGCTDFYVKCADKSGTSPTVSVYCTPIPVR